MSRLIVETVTPHMSGRVLYQRGDRYEEDGTRANEKVAAGLVRVVTGEKAERATADKSAAPSRNKGGRKAKP